MKVGEIRKETFSCTRDGLTIRGLSFLPAGQNLPVAVISHYFLGNYDTTERYARWFAERGYAAFIFDFCGGCFKGRSDGELTQMSVLTEAEDLKAVIRYAWSLPETNGDAVTLMGCSQGGTVAALVAAELKEQVRALILFYPAFLIPEGLREGNTMMSKFDPDHIPDLIPCGPVMLGKIYATDMIGMDMYREIAAYRGRVLILHCIDDTLVDFRYATRARDAYADALLIPIEGSEHPFTEEQSELALTYVDEFL